MWNRNIHFTPISGIRNGDLRSWDGLRQLKELVSKKLKEGIEGTLHSPLLWYCLLAIVCTSNLSIYGTHCVRIIPQIYCTVL